ncbi:MAG: hypothetical protein ACUVQZ_08805 [Candidatus Caldatribacteriaceae bacterium]
MRFIPKFWMAIICLTLLGISLGCISQGDSKLWIDKIGRVHWIELEGGFFGIIAEDETRYEPLNLEKPYQQEGIKVHFIGRVRNDYASIHMWGTIIEITEIEIIWD